MRLDRTYRDAGIHEEWQAVYRKDPLQAVFDDAIYDWLFQELKPTPRWIDAGCGTGHHAFRLAARGCQVVAVDISPAAIAVAEQSSGAFPNGRGVRFLCSSLDELPAGLDMENVHCRGVLMHIPDWLPALDNLCAQVEPGGYLVLFEGNLASLETFFVRLARRIVPVKSKVIRTDSGLEFWSERNGNPFLARVFDLRAIDRAMRNRGFTLFRRRASFLVDINRVPAPLRTPLRLLNWLWFKCHGPFASGVILVYRKTGEPAPEAPRS